MQKTTNKGESFGLSKATSKSIANLMVFAVASIALIVAAIFCLLPSFSIGGLGTQTDRGVVRAATDEPITVTGADLAYEAVTGGVSVTGLSDTFKSTYATHDNITIVVSATDPDSNPIVAIGTLAFWQGYTPDYCFVAFDASGATNLMSIEDYAFSDAITLLSVVLPDSIVSVGEYSFEYTGITSLDLSNTLITSLPNHAFDGTINLTSIDLPNGLTSIGRSAFYYSGVTSLDLSNTLITSLPDYALYSTFSLTSVYFPDGLTSIGKSVFYESGVTSLDLSNTSVTSLPENAFEGAINLTSIDLPDGLINIEAEAFSGCASIESIDLSNTLVTAIPERAFYECTSLVSIELPSGLVSIGDLAFAFSGLTSIDLSNTLITALPVGLFGLCSNLVSIELPSGLTSIGVATFAYCDKLTSIDLSNALITAIPEAAFAECTSLEIIDLTGNKGITAVDTDAFLNTPSTMLIIVDKDIYNTYYSGAFALEGRDRLAYYMDMEVSIATGDKYLSSFGDIDDLKNVIDQVKENFSRISGDTYLLLSDYALDYAIGKNALEAGANTITVSSGKRTSDFDLFLIAMSSISAVFTQGADAIYTSLADLNTLKAKLEVTAINNDGNPAGVLANDEYTLSATAPITNTTGLQSITVTYGSFTTIFNVYFTAVVVASISASFTQGDIIYTSFTDWSNLKSSIVVTATNNDGSSAGTVADGDYTLVPTTTIANTSGMQSITVTYVHADDTFTTTFNIDFTAVEVVSLQISFINTTQPKITLGTTLTQIKAMLKVVGINNDGSEADINTSEFELEDLSIVKGNNTITVEHNGITNTIVIEVTENDSNTALIIILVVLFILTVITVVLVVVLRYRDPQSTRWRKI